MKQEVKKLREENKVLKYMVRHVGKELKSIENEFKSDTKELEAISKMLDKKNITEKEWQIIDKRFARLNSKFK